MKHIYLFLLLNLTLTFSQAQIVNIPDANFKSKLLNHFPVIDTNNDNEIQISEAEIYGGDLKLLNSSNTLDSYKIIDMTGIEAFINIDKLSLKYNLVNNIDLSNNKKLTYFDGAYNELSSLDLSYNTLLTFLDIESNSFNNIDLTFNKALINLNIGKNNFTDIDLAGFEALTYLYIHDNNFSSYSIENFELLKLFSCSGNSLDQLDVSNNINLELLFFNYCHISTIDLTNNTLLKDLRFIGNRLSTLDLSPNIELEVLLCGSNNISEIDVSFLSKLRLIECRDNQITSLDLSSNTQIESAFIGDNYHLQFINLKNGANTKIIGGHNFSNSPNLKTICVDDVNYAIDNFTNVDANVVFVEDCTISDIDYNIIKGVVRMDQDNNGCDINDIIVSNSLIKVTDGVNEFATFTGTNGTYAIPVTQNTYETSPSALAIKTNLSVTPPSYINSFTSFGNTETADFCVNFNQNTYDLNIKLIPISQARPGFDSRYQLVYENLGLTADTGSVTLTFNDAMQRFVSASPAQNNSTSNTLTFDFSDLKPFEKRVIDITMKTFTPPTVNGDDVLNFESTIIPSVSDATPNDNTYNLAQVVVNSFDPNDKQVMQGAEIADDQTDEYLDYLIRFQNTGTASAINVAITDQLNDKLDWDSIKTISSSHPYTTRITNGSFVEFIFDDINLPAEQDNEPASHGFIAFKIKPKSDVVIGDIITGKANIYFDFNAPIITNTVSTEVVDNSLSVLKNELELSLIIYPNPASTEFKIKASNDIIVERVSMYDVTGKQIYNGSNNSETYNIIPYKSGIYFVKVETNKGVLHKQIVKK